MTQGGGVSVIWWAATFIDWMHPASLGFALLLPLIRACLRKHQGHLPCFHTSYVVHDIASGLTIPSFMALAISGVSPDVAKHVEGHAAQLAGLMGIVYTIGAIVKGHPNDIKTNGGLSPPSSS